MWWPSQIIWWPPDIILWHHIIISWPPGKKILAQVCLSGGDQIIWLFGGNVLPAHWPSTAKVHCSCGRERQVLVCCILLKNSCLIRHNYDDTARGVMFHIAKLLINIFKKDRKKIKNLWHPCCGPAQNSFVNHKKHRNLQITMNRSAVIRMVASVVAMDVMRGGPLRREGRVMFHMA